MDKAFDIRLIQEFSSVATDLVIMEWIENVGYVCELCDMKNVERDLPLRLRDNALAVFR